ncbi:hypothetical protein [Bacillus sp. UNC438CL73TsuS30]|uniref:hypothetical protein n=1 Tax=Bacillus sp. UNC438CL73TsuS30 TaxID=1340434 RepID=UPI00047BAE4B|nr:hypothetical protein [Bacillus sp. UNC438CL73TsuS30]
MRKILISNFEKIVFSKIKKEIFAEYSKNRKYNSETSLQHTFSAGQDTETTLEHFIEDPNTISLDEQDIRQIIEEALFEESETFKKINFEYLLTNKEPKEIAAEYKVTDLVFKKIRQRGKALIKRYLVNNYFILEYVSCPDNELKKEKKIFNHREILSD